MKSTSKIYLNLQMPNYNVIAYAVQGDVMSREITAIMHDGQTPFTPSVGALGTVRYRKPDGTSGFYDTLEDETTVAVTWEGNVATIRLAEQVLTVAGNVIMQLTFYNADAERLSTFNFILAVEQSPYTDEEFESTDYYSILTERISAVLNVTTHAPQINELGHWVLWDDEEQDYYDSGVNATGPQGVQGPQGEQGTSIASTSKKSGTGAAGTVDEYNVNLDDGTIAGTFTVYNGSDGQGSPGSSTPQMDGTPSAGTATAYSREDHVHPHDTSKLNASDFVLSSTTPSMDGIGAIGVLTDVARADHVHPSDTSKQDVNESGSNYIKFADGTLICWFSQYFENVNWSASWGNLYETPVALQLNNWPVAFNSTPAVFTQVHTAYGCWVEKVLQQSGTSAGKVAFVRPYSGSGSVSIYVLGIGRWKE